MASTNAPPQGAGRDSDGDTSLSALGFHWLRALASLVVIASATLLLIRLVGNHRMRDMVTDAGPFAPLAFIVLKVLTFVIAPLSGAPLKVVAGTVFGFWHGVAYSVIGDTVGGSLNFLIARRWGWRALRWFMNEESVTRTQAFSIRVGTWRKLAWARLFLTPMYDFVSYAVGLTEIPYPTFLAITSVGAFIPAAFLVWLGTNPDHEGHWLNTGYWIAGVTVIVAAAVMVLIQHKRQGSGDRA